MNICTNGSNLNADKIRILKGVRSLAFNLLKKLKIKLV